VAVGFVGDADRDLCRAWPGLRPVAQLVVAEHVLLHGLSRVERVAAADRPVAKRPLFHGVGDGGVAGDLGGLGRLARIAAADVADGVVPDRGRGRAGGQQLMAEVRG